MKRVYKVVLYFKDDKNRHDHTYYHPEDVRINEAAGIVEVIMSENEKYYYPISHLLYFECHLEDAKEESNDGIYDAE